MIIHPLTPKTKVVAQVATCPCTGATHKQITASIIKVIHNHKGIWYYLDSHVTVKADAISAVVT